MQRDAATGMQTRTSLRRATTGQPVPLPRPQPGQAQHGSAGPAPVLARCGVLAADALELAAQIHADLRRTHAVPVAAGKTLVGQLCALPPAELSALNAVLRCRNRMDFLSEHALACSALMIALGRQLGFDPAELREAGLAGLLLDCGLTQLPLDPAAGGSDIHSLPHAVALRHAELGYDLIAASGLAEPVALAALQHHERTDATGFPMGLSAADLPLVSRMAAVCDAYDQLACTGSGLQAVDPGIAIQALTQMPDRFDSAVLSAFVEAMGLWPTGSLVRMRSGRLGMTIEQDPADCTRPAVRLLRSLACDAHVAEPVAAAARHADDAEIAGPADLSAHDPIDLSRLRSRLLLGSTSGA